MNLKKLVRKAYYALLLLRYGIFQYRFIPGFLSACEAVALYRTARRLQGQAVVVEIGSWKGKSTFCIAKGLASGLVYAIDPFDASGDEVSAAVYQAQKGAIPLLEQFQSFMKRGGVAEKIVPLVGLSTEFTEKFTKIDFLFIDGDHSIESCDFDYTHFAPKIVSGGYVAFHDFGDGREGVGPNWVIHNKVLPSGEYEFVGLYDSLWVGRKK